MIDSTDRSAKELPRFIRWTLRSLRCKRIPPLGIVACCLSLSATPSLMADDPIDQRRAASQEHEDLVPISSDPTAKIIRLAPRILRSGNLQNDAPLSGPVATQDSGSAQDRAPAELVGDFARHTRVSGVAFASLFSGDEATPLQQYEALPQPKTNNTVEVEVEVPALVAPVPVPQPTGADQLDSFRASATESELLESDVLDLRDTIATPSRGQPLRQQTRAALDIRPRSLDESSATLVAISELPADTSGLSHPDPLPHVTQLPAVDLTMCDFWRAASFYHKPLYFEDSRLERYGAIDGPCHHFPSIHSAVHFSWKAGTLPLGMAKVPPCKCVPSGCHSLTPMQRLKSRF